MLNFSQAGDVNLLKPIYYKYIKDSVMVMYYRIYFTIYIIMNFYYFEIFFFAINILLFFTIKLLQFAVKYIQYSDFL